MLEQDLLIQAKNISYNFRKKKILNDVCLEIKKQDFITIIGPNGAGKSSLLEIILGIKKQSSGKVKLAKNIRIGYVPQRIDIDNSIPIEVGYFLKLNKFFDQQNFEQIITQVGIEKMLNKQISNLSGGELQKLLLANALASSPELLILDEPDQNLDLSSQLSFYQLLNKIYKERQMAILMVSHNLHMVMSATKKVICLFHHICCSGEPETISKNPEFKAIFGESMTQLMSVYNHYHNHNHDNCKNG